MNCSEKYVGNILQFVRVLMLLQKRINKKCETDWLFGLGNVIKMITGNLDNAGMEKYYSVKSHKNRLCCSNFNKKISIITLRLVSSELSMTIFTDFETSPAEPNSSKA